MSAAAIGEDSQWLVVKLVFEMCSLRRELVDRRRGRCVVRLPGIENLSVLLDRGGVC